MTLRREIEEPKPVKVDLTYLCPKDPNRKKILEANGVVMPDDEPQHKGGYITDIRFTPEKKRTYDATGRQIEFNVQRKSATWICSTCGSEIKLDPYKV